MTEPSLRVKLMVQACFITVIGGFVVLAMLPYFMEDKAMSFSNIVLATVFSPVAAVMLFVFGRTLMKLFKQKAGAK